MPAEQLGQVALARWIQVRDHDERHAGVARHGIEQLFQRVQPACRRANADDGKVRHRPGELNTGDDDLTRQVARCSVARNFCNWSLGIPLQTTKRLYRANAGNDTFASRRAQRPATQRRRRRRLHRRPRFDKTAANQGIVATTRHAALFDLVARPQRLARPRRLGSRLAQPAAEAALRGDHHRRRRPRSGDRLLPGQGARRARRGRARKGLARRRQHRAQHHDHPLQLPVGRVPGSTITRSSCGRVPRS